MFYGYQIIKSAGRNTIDILNLYEFDTEAEREFWIQSDLSPFPFIFDLFEFHTNSKLGRKKLCLEDARQLMQFGKIPLHLKSSLPKRLLSSRHLSGHYIAIQPESNASEHAFASSFIEQRPCLGIIIRFNSRSESKRFVGSHKLFFGDRFFPIKKSDPILTAASNNGLVIFHDKDDPNFAAHIHFALSHYAQVDPARHFLTLVSFKDWSNPQIFSFDRKSSRDLFICKIKGIKYSPVRVHAISNFNPVAIAFAKRDSILNCTVPDALNFVSSCFLSGSSPDSFHSNSELSVFDSANSALCEIYASGDLS